MQRRRQGRVAHSTVDVGNGNEVISGKREEWVLWSHRAVTSVCGGKALFVCVGEARWEKACKHFVYLDDFFRP